MKKKFFSIILAGVIMSFGLIPMHAGAASNVDAKAKLDSYISAVSSYTSTPHWNLGRSTATENSLKNAVNRGDYTYGITSQCCVGRKSSHSYNTTINGTKGCTSNEFGSAWQCQGFAKYISYVVYGTYPQFPNPITKRGISTDKGFTYYAKEANYPGLQAGDIIRYNYNGVPHAAMVYSAVSGGSIYVVDCNRGSDPCVVNLNKPLPLITENDFKNIFNAGNGYIIRYGGDTTSATPKTSSAPSKPSVTVDGTTVTLSWNTVSGAQYYDAYLVTAPWGWDDIKYSGNTNNTSKTFWNVTPGNYQAFVIARPNADTVQSEWAVVTVSGEQPKPVVDEVTSIKLNRGDFSLTAGESVKLKETIEKTNPATWYFATWESSNPSVASVRQDGTVDAKKAGNTTITASAGGKYAKVNVEVLPTQEDVSANEPPKREPVRATSIRVYPESVSLSAGETALLTATVYPADAEDKVVWESFDSSIASVNSSGLVTAKSGGMTTVSATAGGKKVTAMVNVSTPITESMITTTPAPEPKPEPEPPRNNVSFSSIRATDVSQSNAKLNGTCSYSGSTPSEVGVYLGTSSGSMQFVGKDYINHSKNPFDMWYTLNKYGFTLSPGTTYYYKFYAIVDGNEYTSGTSSFTTPSAPANNGTVTGYINGTPGGLAINSQPKSGTKIGRIPEGSYCTVYPSRRSGNWYWVEYNGVSGYAYSQYISLV